MSRLQINRIKVMLAEQQKTGKELARHLMKTESTVSRWCTNEIQPSLETLYEIALFLQVDIRDLLVPTKW